MHLKAFFPTTASYQFPLHTPVLPTNSGSPDGLGAVEAHGPGKSASQALPSSNESLVQCGCFPCSVTSWLFSQIFSFGYFYQSSISILVYDGYTHTLI